MTDQEKIDLLFETLAQMFEGLDEGDIDLEFCKERLEKIKQHVGFESLH